MLPNLRELCQKILQIGRGLHGGGELEPGQLVNAAAAARGQLLSSSVGNLQLCWVAVITE